MTPANLVEKDLEKLLENLSAENSQYITSIAEITYDYVLTHRDVPDHVKKNVNCLREMYTIVNRLGERKSDN